MTIVGGGELQEEEEGGEGERLKVRSFMGERARVKVFAREGFGGAYGKGEKGKEKKEKKKKKKRKVRGEKERKKKNG